VTLATNILSPANARLVTRSTSARVAGILASFRFQLPAALLIGIPVPAILRHRYEEMPDTVLNYDTSMLGITAAILFGYLVYRKITSLPGTSALLNQIPGFAISYLSVAAFFFALRLDFSRQQFVLSFVLVTVLFVALTLTIARLRRAVYGFVPGGRTDVLSKITHVDWVRFDKPFDAQMAPDVPIVVDLNYHGLSHEWERFLADAAISGRRVFNTKQLRESLEGQVSIDHLSENSFGHLAPDSIYAPAKFYIDFVFALVALVFLAPLLLLIAIWIRLDSAGPALFKQQRMGHRGKAFTLYKFRSMRVATSETGNTRSDMTSKDDDRITWVGRFIRRMRIDELPQIINILLGQMSWIGPRPETIALSEWYERDIPFYRYRHIVRPGITGWAQIKQGHVTSVDDVKEKLEYDFFYVRNFSIWLDILIVMQTLRVVLTGHGSK
jgi:lipopolysaccharide/colanic/teichoic acid biosynthesis glycosyltransferase